MNLKEKKKCRVIIVRLLLLGYLILIFTKTVVFRPSQFSYKHHFAPLWSYMAIKQGYNELIAENILNVLLFIPIGFLFYMVIKSARWWAALIFGAIISITIECCQFAFNRGSAEFDDVIHNVLGCMLGYGIVFLFKKVYEVVSKRRIRVL